MPELKTYDVFISHAWSHNDDYVRLEKILQQANLFKWRNYSVTEDCPVVDPEGPEGKEKLLECLDKQIRPVNVVLILGGMYAAYSHWIQDEIRIAVSYGKPIIGIYPWGQQKMPVIVQEAAIELVGWNTHSIVEAVRKHSI